MLTYDFYAHIQRFCAGARISCMSSQCREIRDRIADIPTAATPLVSALSVLHDLPMVTPREPKEHGTKATVEGAYEAGMMVCLFDDLITKATSKLAAIKTLETVGLRVKDVCVIVDREQGGREELAENGYILHAAFSLRELIESCYLGDVITFTQHDEVMKYLDSQKK